LGAAYVAGLQAGVFSSLDQINQKWQVDLIFKPEKDDGWRERQYAGWKNAVERTKS
jgi:Glycerol kinase